MNDDRPTYVTLDGSLIREIIRPEGRVGAPVPGARAGSRHLSLAEALIAPGQTTKRHRHRQSEEIYYVLSGEGEVEVAGVARRVQPGDAVLIPPHAEHRATATGNAPLRLLCACSPPYQHEDTVLTESPLV